MLYIHHFKFLFWAQKSFDGSIPNVKTFCRIFRCGVGPQMPTRWNIGRLFFVVAKSTLMMMMVVVVVMMVWWCWWWWQWWCWWWGWWWWDVMLVVQMPSRWNIGTQAFSSKAFLAKATHGIFQKTSNMSHNMILVIEIDSWLVWKSPEKICPFGKVIHDLKDHITDNHNDNHE